MAGDGEVARQIAEPARGLHRSGIFGMGDADDAGALLEPRRRGSGDDHLARRLAAQLLWQRKGGAAGELVAGESAGAVFYVPARHRAGEIFDQHVALAQRRQIVFAEDEFVRAAIFE